MVSNVTMWTQECEGLDSLKDFDRGIRNSRGTRTDLLYSTKKWWLKYSSKQSWREERKQPEKPKWAERQKETGYTTKQDNEHHTGPTHTLTIAQILQWTQSNIFHIHHNKYFHSSIIDTHSQQSFAFVGGLSYIWKSDEEVFVHVSCDIQCEWVSQWFCSALIGWWNCSWSCLLWYGS